MVQREEGIQERAREDQEREQRGPVRETIDIGMVSLPRKPKACPPALPAERTPQRRGTCTSIT